MNDELGTRPIDVLYEMASVEAAVPFFYVTPLVDMGFMLGNWQHMFEPLWIGGTIGANVAAYAAYCAVRVIADDDLTDRPARRNRSTSDKPSPR